MHTSEIMLKFTNLVLVLFINYGVVSALSTNSTSLVVPGHVNIGVLVNLHEETGAENCSAELKPWALQEIITLEWTLSVIGNQSKSGGIKFGMKIFDNCGSEDRLIRQAVKLSEEAELEESPIIGIISLGGLDVSKATVSVLHAFSIPLVTTQPSSEKLLKADHVFTTAPHLRNHMQAVIEVIDYKARIYGNRPVGVISSCENALNVLESVSKKNNIKIDDSLLVDTKNRTKFINDTKNFLISEVGFQGIVVLLLETESLLEFAESLSNTSLAERAEWFWILAVLNGASTSGQLDTIVNILERSVVIQPYSPPLPGLYRYLNDVHYIKNFSVVAPLLDELNVDPKYCQYAENCSFARAQDVLSGIRAASVVKAASSLVSAFRLVQLKKCPENSLCPALFGSHLGPDMVDGLSKVSYFSRETSDNNRYTADGRFISRITLSRRVYKMLKQIAMYREDKGIVWFHPIPGIDNLNAEIGVIDGDMKRGEIGPLQHLMFNYYDKLGMLGVLMILTWSSLGCIFTLYCGIYMVYLKFRGLMEESFLLDSIMLCNLCSCFASGIFAFSPPSQPYCTIKNVVPFLSLMIFFSAMLFKTYLDRKPAPAKEKIKFFAILRYFTPIQLLIAYLFGTAALTASSIDNDYDEKGKMIRLDPEGFLHCTNRLGFVMYQTIYIVAILVINISIQYLMANLIGFTRKRILDFNRTIFLIIFVFCWIKMIRGSTGLNQEMNEVLGYLTIASVILFTHFYPTIFVLMKQWRKIKHKNRIANQTLATICAVRRNMNPQPSFCEPPYIRPWRMDPESPIIHYAIPPPPPPPLKKDFAYCQESRMGHIIDFPMDDHLIYSK